MRNDTTQVVYLYFYTDSVAFPRIEDQRLDQTWPFMLKDMLEAESGVRVYPCLRGLGGATIGEIRSIFLRDIGYFRGQGKGTVSILILNTGIVDAAPQPFTFFLRRIAKLPRIGPRLWHYIQKPLIPSRAFLQRVWSYRQTAPDRFQNIFNQLVRHARRAEMNVISIDTPLTPTVLEARSPGLRASIDLFNSLKHENADVMHISMEWVEEEHLLRDFHHFKPEGHRILAAKLLSAVRSYLTD